MSRQYRGNLPVETTSFVDRRRETAEAKRLLSAARLLTLTGVGGVGKTRLALRVAHRVQRAFTDGVWLVELAVLQDYTLLEQTIADTIGLRDHTVRPAREALTDHLREKHLLLLLDNCEHMAEQCAGLVVELLAVAPRLRILATSRHALSLPGEQILAVPPLPLPDLRFLPQFVGPLHDNDAVQLFMERAKLTHPEFKITESNQTTIARICHRLDGLPLAVELGAARLRILSPEQILHRLDDRFRLLRTGSQTVQPRHQTLRAVVDWSYELCSPAEQILWARASVFAGRFELDAAEAVCAGDGITREQVLDLMAGLVDKSILIRDDRDHAPQAQYRLLDTLRHYGHDFLRAAGDHLTLRRRHRDYYLDAVERGSTEWFGHTQLQVAARARREHDNLRLALEYCLSTPGESQTALRMTAALHYHWHCGFVTEGRLWLTRALALDSKPTMNWANALWTNAHLALLQGDLSAAETMAQELRDWAERHDIHVMDPYILHIEGAVAHFRGDFQRAQVLLEEALARFDSLGELNAMVILTQKMLSGVALFQGNLERATKLSREASDLCDQHGERWTRAYAHLPSEHIKWVQGDLTQANADAKESLRVLHAFNDTFGTALRVELLAWIAATAGEFERAAVLLGVVQQLWHLIGGRALFGSAPLLAAHEACVREARQALSDHSFQTAFDRGTAFSLDQAIAYALEETPAPPARTTDVADTTGKSLTRRELEVAELVAQGLSNKEIAVHLVIAQRTAEGHIERIFAKLGFTTRTQLAAWIITQGSQASR